MPYLPSATSYHTTQEAVRSKEAHSDLIPVCLITLSVFTTLLGTTEELLLGNMHAHRMLTFPIWMTIETVRLEDLKAGLHSKHPQSPTDDGDDGPNQKQKIKMDELPWVVQDVIEPLALSPEL